MTSSGLPAEAPRWGGHQRGVDPSQVDPVRRTISEYALGDHRSLFDAGVLLLAAGSAACWWAHGWLAPSLLLSTWSGGRSGRPRLGGYVHRYAGLLLASRRRCV